MSKQVNQETFERLCRIQCTTDEICSVLGLERKALARWAKRTYGKALELVLSDFQADGKSSFRRLGIQLAEQGSASVWIFLAKNWLGMSDNPAPVASGEESKELAKAITTASKALAKMDISTLATVPSNLGEDKANG